MFTQSLANKVQSNIYTISNAKYSAKLNYANVYKKMVFVTRLRQIYILRTSIGSKYTEHSSGSMAHPIYTIAFRGLHGSNGQAPGRFKRSMT